MSTQLIHENTEFETKTFPITVICDEIYFQQNIGSIFRICDAFGVEKIYFTGEHFILSDRKVNKTSRNTHKTVPYEVLKDKNELINIIKNGNYQVIALEITDDSIPVEQLKITNQPIALILGSEIYGISSDLLQIANQCTHIPMYGKNSSMNVVQAAAIILHRITSII
ncbi:TrmH family RNA methyltransferase [Flavobacterium chuncheonense]|uniref:TrmH family RNA methyltransferase n=1 Tax=Flavobacterium chuncheonense TaxID=2026653 RepID=A0ABW5YI06_9FLAO